MTLEEEVSAVKAALEGKGATDIKAYDVRGISGLADVFVVATGSASPHLKALVTAAEEAVSAAGSRSHRISGDPESGWIVVDCIDVVVHVFSPEARAYYALEKLWYKAPLI